MKDEIKLHFTDFIPDANICEERKKNSSVSTKSNTLSSNNPAEKSIRPTIAVIQDNVFFPISIFQL
jgi:hypothetical protein